MLPWYECEIFFQKKVRKFTHAATDFENGLNHNLNLKRTSPRLFLNRVYVLYIRCNIKKIKKTTTIRTAQKHTFWVIPSFIILVIIN